jgi:hypothetical protein
MGMMDMHARREYRRVVRDRYWKARTKKEKSQMRFSEQNGHRLGGNWPGREVSRITG